jgi:hypothetical protein
MYVIRRRDQGGGFVAPPGSKRAHTFQRLRAQIYRTREAAEADRCVDNEVVEPLFLCFETIVVKRRDQ